MIDPLSRNQDPLLEFSVEQAGVVYLIASWKSDGDRSGGWSSQQLSKEELEGQGWDSLGPCPWDNDYTLFLRGCRAGEVFRIRTRKFGAPSPIQGAMLELTDPDHVRLLAQGITEPFYRGRMRDHIEAGEFDTLNRHTEWVREHGPRFPSGNPYLTVLCEGVASGGLSHSDDDLEWEDRRDMLEQWAATQPDWATPQIALGMHLKDYAWKARGNGRGSSVTGEGRSLFRERLNEAAE